MGRGRKTDGPALVEGAEGSREAKRRMKAVLEVIAGKKTIGEASQELGIGEAMLHRLKTRVIQAGIESLEARPPGRKPKDSRQKAGQEELEEKLERIEAELVAARVRAEVALLVPELVVGGVKKKRDDSS